MWNQATSRQAHSRRFGGILEDIQHSNSPPEGVLQGFSTGRSYRFLFPVWKGGIVGNAKEEWCVQRMHFCGFLQRRRCRKAFGLRRVKVQRTGAFARE